MPMRYVARHIIHASLRLSHQVIPNRNAYVVCKQKRHTWHRLLPIGVGTKESEVSVHR